MKACPSCGSQYTDDTLSFCLADGARLADTASDSAATVVIGEVETSVRPRVSNDIPFSEVRRPKNRTGIAVLLTAMGMLFLFGVVVVVGFFVWRSLDSAAVTQTDNQNATPNSSTPRTSPTKLPIETPSRPTPAPTIERTPAPRASYRSTTRLTMGKGAYSVPFSGEINPGDTRTFVLACRSGQSLSATVSGGTCVSFSGGGTSLTRKTSAGDNSVTVTNNCSAMARFSIRVSVI